ncbi:uncharacterized protein LOC121708697 isoform X1 [Alosa sapidissima]|uniref:uncharacterized protein LOC121708697 isoform X1 n=1 Tax=Alosa sapidissima TaxID=34773 RepID=UPI001C096EE1|nr:uncharacterized protein LOC121708697 isoform X1 [Alosa sapidissima]
MAGCDEGPEDDFCLRWTWVKVIVMVCCYGEVVRGGQSPAKVVTGGNLTARSGDSVTFRCEVRNGSHIITVEWTRCDRGAAPSKVLVFMTSGSQLSLSDTHQGRVTMTTASSFTLRNVSMEDFGLYCCKLNVFPDGVLQAEVHLNEEADHAASQRNMLLVTGVVCAVVLVIVVTTVIVCKKRRVQLRDYVNVSVHQGSVPKGPDDTGQENVKSAENIKGAEENMKGAEENIKGAEQNIRSTEENIKGAEQNIRSTEENIKGAEETDQRQAILAPCARSCRGSVSLGPEEAEMTTQQHAT